MTGCLIQIIRLAGYHINVTEVIRQDYKSLLVHVLYIFATDTNLGNAGLLDSRSKDLLIIEQYCSRFNYLE